MSGRRVRLRFDAALYSGRAVRQVAADFAEVAVVRITADRRGLVVSLQPRVAIGPDRLGDVFANHVLARTVEALRR